MTTRRDLVGARRATMTSLRRPARRRGGGPLAERAPLGLAFLAPTLLGLTVLSAGPILATLAISLTKWDLLTAPKLDRLRQLHDLLSDDRFLKALRNTFFYTMCRCPWPGDRAGLAMALNQAIRGIAFIRTMYFLPLVTSTMAIGLVWLWIYAPRAGLLNEVLGAVGIPPSSGWVTDPSGDAVDHRHGVWQGLGVNVIIFLAAAPGDPEGASRRGERRRGRPMGAGSAASSCRCSPRPSSSRAC